MKKKNGFIAISLLYSFFLIFIVLIIAIINSYAENRVTQSLLIEDIKESLNGGNVNRKTIIDKSGVYQITATGAEGGQGNKYSYPDSTYKGGKGAKLVGTFNLNVGDVLYVIVGNMGTTTVGISADGASGAGGGGTFVFKEINAITDSRYQFSKGTKNYEILMVVAGGGGTGDFSYSSSYASNGYDANGENYYSPSNYTSWATNVVYPATSYSSSGVLSINQFINYNLLGNTYTRNNSTCTGGYGGGGCADDQRTYGGGWNGANYITYSFSSAISTTGTNGFQTGNGTFQIEFVG